MGAQGLMCQTHHDYISFSKNITFSWGENDCCLWVARYVDLVSGSRILSQWIGKYNTAEGASVTLNMAGFKTPEDVADYYLLPKDKRMALRGDIVMHQSGALGICDGRKSFFLSESNGIVEFLTINCKRAWSIKCRQSQ